MIPSELNPATVNWTATAVSNSPNTTSEMTKLVGLRRFDSLSMLAKIK